MVRDTRFQQARGEDVEPAGDGREIQKRGYKVESRFRVLIFDADGVDPLPSYVAERVQGDGGVVVARLVR